MPSLAQIIISSSFSSFIILIIIFNLDGIKNLQCKIGKSETRNVSSKFVSVTIRISKIPVTTSLNLSNVEELMELMLSGPVITLLTFLMLIFQSFEIQSYSCSVLSELIFITSKIWLVDSVIQSLFVFFRLLFSLSEFSVLFDCQCSQILFT